MGKFINITVLNPLKTIKQLKGIFLPIKVKFTTDFTKCPLFWGPKPSPIQIVSFDVGWKDKYATPRFEQPPFIWIHLFKFDLIWYWVPDKVKYVDDFWEQALWYLYYSDKDIITAKETWPWTSIEGGYSTWRDNYVIYGKSKK